jgi:hypothetical protein
MFMFVYCKEQFLIVALAVLKLTLWIRLALNSEICLPLRPQFGIKDVCHHQPAHVGVFKGIVKY